MDIKSVRTQIQAKFAQVLAGQAVDVSQEPEGELEGGDQPIGIVKSPLTRSLYSLHADLIDAVAASAKATIKGKPGSPEWLDAKVALDREIEIADQLAKALGASFWSGVMEEFPQAADRGVNAGIRAGWQVAIKLDLCECRVCQLRRTIEAVENGEAGPGVLGKIIAQEFGKDMSLPPELVEMLGDLDAEGDSGFSAFAGAFRRPRG